MLKKWREGWKSLDNLFQLPFPKSSTSFPIFFLVLIPFDKLSRYLGQQYISPGLVKLPLFANVDVTPESRMWAAQVRNREVVPSI